jgi:hypothetical protein
MTEQSEDESHSNEKKSNNDKRTDSHMTAVRPGTAA